MQSNWHTERAVFSLYDGRQELAQYAQNTHIANDDNAWFHQWINRGWRGRFNNHPTLSSEQSTGNTEGELEAYRKLTYLPEQVAGVYGQLLSQELYGSTRAEFKFGYNGHGYAWGYINNRNQKHFASKLYFSQDAQNSTIKVTGENNEHSYRYAYTPFGQAYGFSDRRTNQWRNKFYAKDYLNAHVVPYLYTGRYTDPVTGLANMDARWYDAKTGRFVQTDQYNHANLMLPRGAQSELMRYIGRSQGDLLRDPAQQMRYGYVSGNALRWTDPLGLEPLTLMEDVSGQNTNWSKDEILEILDSTLTGSALIGSVSDDIKLVGYTYISDPDVEAVYSNGTIYLPANLSSDEVVILATHEMVHDINQQNDDGIKDESDFNEEVQAFNIQLDIWEELGRPQSPYNSNQLEYLSDKRTNDPDSFNDFIFNRYENYEANQTYHLAIDKDEGCYE